MTRTCEWNGCGKIFTASRADARYCSASCRAAASKERRKEVVGEIDLEPAEPTGPAEHPFNERLDLVERLFRVEEKAQDLEEDLAALNAKMGDVKALRRELAQAMAALDQQIPAQDNTLDEEVIAGLENRIAALEQAPIVDPWPRHIRANLLAVENRLVVLEGRAGEPSVAGVAMAERMDRLEGDYAELVRLVLAQME